MKELLHHLTAIQEQAHHKKPRNEPELLVSQAQLRDPRRDLADLQSPETGVDELLAILLLELPELRVDFEDLVEVGVVLVAVAVVVRELSDFGEFLVGFVEERPVDFADRNARVLLHLHFGASSSPVGFGGGEHYQTARSWLLLLGCINVGVDQLNTDRPQSRLLCSDADCSSVVRPPLGVQPVARAPHRRPGPHYVLRVRRGAPAREKRRREDDCLSDRVSDTGHGGECDWYGKLRLVVPNMIVLLDFQDKLREGRIEQKKDFWVRRRSSNSGHGGGYGWCW
ncbi:hypothetical protein ACLB2K_058447 [Fragaria x ananassa]